MRAAAALALAAGLALLAAAAAPAQSFSGIALGQPLPADLPTPTGRSTEPGFVYSLWSLPDGTTLSATQVAETGHVIYVERWRTEPGTEPDTPLPGLTYGATTAGDLAARFGSEGLVFSGRGRAAPFGDIVAVFTSYEIAGTGAILAFVTILPLAEAGPEAIPASRLDSVILADGAYLDTIWGPGRGTTDGYAPIADPLP